MKSSPAIVLDMAISHGEFRRTLTQAFGASVVPLGPQEFRVEVPDGAVRIVLGRENTRRMASLSYPATLVTIQLAGLDEAGDRFMARFYQYFQRGGG